MKKESTSAQVTSFVMPHSGALAKAKFRTEADLSPSEGKLVLFEYCEERPPIQPVKGMRIKVSEKMLQTELIVREAFTSYVRF